MQTYENQVQKVKNEVLTKVAKYAYEKTLSDHALSIADEINHGPNARFRCCVHKEKVITNERVKLAVGQGPFQVNVIEAACDKCRENRYVVNSSCRGCIAHKCITSCPVDAINIIKGKAVIDDDKCIECGRCHQSCPYEAISDVRRPCVKVCPVNAITVDDNKKAVIEQDKCIQCGACIYYCPFGAIQENSQLVNVITALKSMQPVYALIAPSIAAQFALKDINRVSGALKELGFKDVIEVALGADMIVETEAKEFVEGITEKINNGVLTSSCCPAAVAYVNDKYSQLSSHISHTVSPMIATARLVKSIEKKAITVFIGPCIAKKEEAKQELDYVLTFEEVLAMLSGLDINLATVEEAPLNNASMIARQFASSGGVSKAIDWYIGQLGQQVEYDVIQCNGIKEVDKILKLIKANKLKNTFVELMACEGGCIKGPVALHHGAKDKAVLNNYCKMAKEKTPIDAIRVFDLENISLTK